MNITQEFSLNKHPFAVNNMSLVTARNIKVDNDYSNICNEESVRYNETIHNFLQSYFGERPYKIVGWIPCNVEIVVFAFSEKQNDSDADKSIIFRYIENENGGSSEVFEHYYTQWEYSGGEIFGTFTYNLNNALIIMFSEYNTPDGKEIPIKTINLGCVDNFDDFYSDISYGLSDSLLPLCPEVRLPYVNNLEYFNGYAYKGVYFLFIRYKISQYDYTQWYDIGFPIYVDELKKQNIIKYYYNRAIPYHEEDGQKNGHIEKSTQPDCLYQYYSFYNKKHSPVISSGYMVGCSDSFSIDKKIINKSFSVNLSFYKNCKSILDNYKYYQIGFICALNTETLCYRTDDIAFSKWSVDESGNPTQLDEIFVLDINKLVQTSQDELTTIYQNYYNTKVLYNYKNKVYISDYKERNLNDNNDSIVGDDGCIKKITVSLGRQEFITHDNLYDFTLITPYPYAKGDNVNVPIKSCYGLHGTTPYQRQILLSELFGIDDNTEITVYYGTLSKQDVAKNFIITTYSKSDSSSGTLCGYDFGFCELVHVNYDSYNRTSLDYLIRSTGGGGAYFVIDGSDEKISIFCNDKNIASVGFSLMSAIFPEKSFDERINHATLLPNEVYSFYIHFVDKYGAKSVGYKIENNCKYIYNNNEVVPVEVDGYIYLIPFETTVYDFLDTLLSKISSQTLSYFSTTGRLNYFVIGDDGNYTVSGSVTSNSNRNKYFFKAFHTFYTERYKNVRWFEIVSAIDGYFGQYENVNGERFYKVPFYDIYFGNSITTLNDTTNAGFLKYVNIKKNVHNYQYYPIFNNIHLPDNSQWIGFFFSMERMEKSMIATGFLTRSDFISQNYIIGTTGSYQNLYRVDCANAYPSDWMCFYSDEFDIYDMFDNEEPCAGYFTTCPSDALFKNWDTLEDNFIQPTGSYDFPLDFNKCQLYNSYSGSHNRNYYGIDHYMFAKGHDETKGRYGKGSCVMINDVPGLFDNTFTATSWKFVDASYEGDRNDESPRRSESALLQVDCLPNQKNSFYKADLRKMSRSIYKDKQKALIRISDTTYMTSGQYCKTASIIRGIIGHNTVGGVLVYNNRGVVLDGNNTVVTNKNEKHYYPKRNAREWTDNNEGNDFRPIDGTWMNDTPFAAYVQYYTCDNKMHESKMFNNKPDAHGFGIDTQYEDNGMTRPGCIVLPQNSTDLFKNPIGDIINLCPVTYTNFQSDIEYPYSYPNTIRRSNVIQDESLMNNWRHFDLEDYKMVNDNVGKIVNITAINKRLYIHCEHSLFMLNADPTLKSEEKSLSFAEQDIFDVDYDNIIPSELGYAGLQDRKAAICDTFGYMFYDNSSRRMFMYQNNKIKLVDDDIKLWLYKYAPYNVRFCNDRKNSRILIKMNYNFNNEAKTIVISFNYKINKFISLHDYYFDDCTSTKNISYLFCDSLINEECDCFCNFVQDGTEYGRFVNIKGNKGESQYVDSKIGIIYNSEYDSIKRLESITYKLNKKDDSQNVDYTDYFEEVHETPFSGNALRVYNNLFSTGEIDISIDTEAEKNLSFEKDMPYLKPYWKLGNWNFNFLRDKGSEYVKYWKQDTEEERNENDPHHEFFDTMPQIEGNYFIVEFLFDNERNNGHKIEFERLTCNNIKDF